MKRDLATQIADTLFFDADRHEGKRLAIVIEEGPSDRMAVWCKKAVIREIRRIILLRCQEHATDQPKDR